MNKQKKKKKKIKVQRRCVCRQNIKTRRKPLKKWVILIALQFRYTFYRPQTKRLRARKIGLQYKILFLLGTSCLGRPSGDGLWSPFRRRAVRQRGYGLRLLIFKMANNKVDLGQIRSEEIVYSRLVLSETFLRLKISNSFIQTKLLWTL